MTPAALIERLAERGVRFELVNDAVEVIGAERLTEAELATLREHKSALRCFLESQANNKAANDTAHGPTRAELAAALGLSFAVEVGPGDRVRVDTSEVLARAADEDLADLLMKPSVLVAFAASLVADGLIDSWVEWIEPEPELPPQLPVVVQVRCNECRHFLPDAIGDGQGVGRCAIDAPEQRRQPPSERYPAGHYGVEPALWPNAWRCCEQFEGP